MPPKATRNAVAAALTAIEIDTAAAHGTPLIEETIGPAEVWQPTRDQYRSVAGRYCQQHGELEQLRESLRGADAWADIQRGCIEELDARCRDLLWQRKALAIALALVGLALTGLMCAVAWRLW